MLGMTSLIPFTAETAEERSVMQRRIRIVRRIDSLPCFLMFAIDNLKIFFMLYHPISFKNFCKDSLLF